METKELIQEDQYHFPYHHLTHVEDDSIFVFRHLFWGLVHLTYITYVLEKIVHQKPESLADIGCGEGRIITELEKKLSFEKLLGFDISKRAINFANAFSNYGEFRVHDITDSPLPEKVNFVVSCEVIEHIEPSKVPQYIKNIHESLNDGGEILLTTPATNVSVNAKHYQHFTSEMFDELLHKNFTNIQYEYLNKVNVFSKFLERVIANRLFLSNSKLLNRFVLKAYRRWLLHADKKTGSRILVRATKS